MIAHLSHSYPELPLSLPAPGKLYMHDQNLGSLKFYNFQLCCYFLLFQHNSHFIVRLMLQVISAHLCMLLPKSQSTQILSSQELSILKLKQLLHFESSQ